eukprot:Skav211513  [mRNA]  locus=scaffold352:135759:137390:- [translate_table: standard]
METCCDNPGAIQRNYDMFGVYVNLATCLRSIYLSNTTSYRSILDCERSFIPTVLDLFAPDIPPKLQNVFMEMHNQLGERLVSATEGFTEDILVKPLSIKDFSLRYALRLLEHLLMPPPILVSQGGAMKFWRAVEQLGAGKLHATLSSEQRRLRLRKLPASAPPSAQEVVHLAMVASMGQPPFGRKALATLRSALFHAKLRKLHFHLFVDTAGRADVEAAMEQHLENWLKLRVAKVDFYTGSDLKEFGRVLNRYVPQGCTSYNQGYGFPSWMRLFPHEIKWKVDLVDLIWVDAGDFLFFADPSLLLDQHKDLVNPETSTVASHPDKEDYAYVFNLPKMRAVKWTVKVGRMIGLELATNQSGGYDELCRQAEVWCMYGMVAKYPDLFATVPGEWSHIPRIPFYNGASQRHRDLSNPEEAQLWKNREHPGVIDPTRAFIFCPSFLDWWAHAMAGLPLPFFAVEVAQAFEHLAMESSFVLSEGHYAESGTYGYQKMNCGRPVLGMHLIRQYHVDVPWSLRLLDFWSNVPGLWGGEKKSLPSSASEAD